MTEAGFFLRATLQRLAEKQAHTASSSTAASTLQQSVTHVPRPDRRPECKAHIGLCQCNALWSATNVQLMHHKLAGRARVLDPQSNLFKEASIELLSGFIFSVVFSAVFTLSYCQSSPGMSAC